MSIDPSKLPDSSIRLNIPVGTPFGATEANAASAQIQQLKLENEQLRRDKFEIEQKLQEEIRIIKANLRDEKEQREEIQDKIKKAEESARNKKKERMKLIDELQIEKDDKNRSVKREKEIEEQLIQKEKEKRKVEQELRYEREEKKESQINLEELEKKNKIEVEKRRKAEDEKERISFENNNLRIENERLKKQLGQETNHVSENETKYLIEAEENKRIKKETEERIKVESQLRQQSEKEKRDLLKQLENNIQQIQQTKKTNHEQIEKILVQQNEIKKKEEDYLKQQECLDNLLNKTKEEERKRKESEILKEKTEQENFELKITNERIVYEVYRMKEKYGEENIDSEIGEIENKEKQNLEKIQQLEKSIKQKCEEYQKERQEKERMNQELLRERNEKEKEKKRANDAEAEILATEQKNNKLNQENAKLKEENLKLNQNQIKVFKDYPITIINSDPTDFNIVDIDGKQKKLIKRGKNEIANTVSLSEVLEYGIWELEVQFSNNGQCGAIGIVDNSYNIPAQADPDHSPHVNHMAIYAGAGWNSGKVQCKGSNTSGNKSFEDNQIIKAEYDSEKGTLIWFVDGVQQPVYITGIRERVKFMISLYNAGSICTIRSLKKLANPTCKHLGNENTVHW